MPNKSQIQFSITGLSGKSGYILEPLTRRESLKIFHAAVETVVSGLGSVLSGFGKSQEISEDKLLGALKALDFDKLYDIGRATLRAAVIVNDAGKFDINQLDESDYFDDRPEEFYLAIAYAIKENFPNVFFTLTRALKDFGGSDGAKNLVEGLLLKFQKTP